MNRVTANLPSRNLDATVAFQGRLAFAVAGHGADWLFLDRRPLEIEFLPHPGVDRGARWSSACVPVADLDALRAQPLADGVSAGPEGTPRIAPIAGVPDGLRMPALVDPAGSLLCCRAEDAV